MKKKKLAEKLNKKFSNVRASTVYEGKTKIVLYHADAKKNTPFNRLSPTGRIHVGTYVPSTKKTFVFSGKYAKKKKK